MTNTYVYVANTKMKMRQRVSIFMYIYYMGLCSHSEKSFLRLYTCVAFVWNTWTTFLSSFLVFMGKIIRFCNAVPCVSPLKFPCLGFEVSAKRERKRRYERDFSRYMAFYIFLSDIYAPFSDESEENCWSEFSVVSKMK